MRWYTLGNDIHCFSPCFGLVAVFHFALSLVSHHTDMCSVCGESGVIICTNEMTGLRHDLCNQSM